MFFLAFFGTFSSFFFFFSFFTKKIVFFLAFFWLLFSGQPVMRMQEKTRKVMKNHFSTAYYLAKNEKPFSDFLELLDLQELNSLDVQKGYRTDRAVAVFIDFIAESMKLPLKECLMKAKYYSVLQDGSTDTSVSEQELVYVLFLYEG